LSEWIIDRVPKIVPSGECTAFIDPSVNVEVTEHWRLVHNYVTRFRGRIAIVASPNWNSAFNSVSIPNSVHVFDRGTAMFQAVRTDA
jgi:hypothetical protein